MLWFSQRLVLVQAEVDDDVVAGKVDRIHSARGNPGHVNRIGVGKPAGIGQLRCVCRRAYVVPELRNAQGGAESHHQNEDSETAQGESGAATAATAIPFEQEEHDADEHVDQLDQEHHEHTGECVGPKMLASMSPAFRVKLHRYRLMKLP